LYELVGQFDQLGLNEAECVEGLCPNDLFIAHMSLVEYSSYFIKIEQFKEGGVDNLNHLETSTDEALNDMEESSNTNEFYRQQGSGGNVSIFDSLVHY
jgi:hypothetical protein